MSVQVSGDKITFADSSVLGSAWTGFKNRIINGAMVIDQRGSSSSAVTVNSSTRTYATDRFFGFGTSSAGVFTEQQVTDVPTGSGFVNSTKITVTTASSPSGSQTYGWGQGIEGLNVADFMFGSASAKTITLSFWVKSSLTGTFSVILANYGGARTYPATYTISAANTWEQKTITVAGDVTGTWLTNNSEGLAVLWMLGTGSSLHGTANAWTASKFGVSGQTDVIATSGATFYTTGVQLEKGSTATSFDYRPYGTELALCQRYYSTSFVSYFTTYGAGSNAPALGPIKFPTTMRTAPTVAFSNITYHSNSSGLSGIIGANVDGFQPVWTLASTGYSQVSFTWSAPAEL